MAHCTVSAPDSARSTTCELRRASPAKCTLSSNVARAPLLRSRQPWPEGKRSSTV